MFNIGFSELMIILVIALVIFGPNKLPELAKAIGKGLAEFKKATKEFKENIDLDGSIKEIKEDLKLDENIREIKNELKIDESIQEIKNELKISESIQEIKDSLNIDESIKEIKEDLKLDENIREIKNELNLDENLKEIKDGLSVNLDINNSADEASNPAGEAGNSPGTPQVEEKLAAEAMTGEITTGADESKETTEQKEQA